VPHHGSRSKEIAERVTPGCGRFAAPLLYGLPEEPAPVGARLNNVDAGVALRKSLATSLRISHAIPCPVHRSIRSCKLTRPTLSSGTSWPSLPRVSLRRLPHTASVRTRPGRCHPNHRLIHARLLLAQRTECSQPGKAVSTKERPHCSKAWPQNCAELSLNGVV
jgi:hypothetical protein